MTTHLITGVTGQDGVLLARLLVAEGGRVVGTHSPGSLHVGRMAPYLEGVETVALDVRDDARFARLVADIRPDEVYNLAAMSSVGASWDTPEEAMAINGDAPVRMLQTLASYGDVRFLQAASAEQSGAVADSPYARGKARAAQAVRDAREDGRFAVSAVLHIHESPIRRPGFVVRKVTRAVAEIALGRRERLSLGNTSVRRDWGAAEDHVRAMRMMLAADEATDFEVATGVVHSLHEIVGLAFAAGGVSDPWSVIDHDPLLIRPADTAELRGDSAPIRAALGWEPVRTLEETVARMVAVDIERLRTGVEERDGYLRVGAGLR